MTTGNKIKALAKFAECELDDVSENNYGSYDAEGGEFLVLTDDEADTNAAEYIEESLWAFNASFIIDNTDLPYEAKEMIESFQRDKCEGANDTIRAMIQDMGEFTQAAISADGRGHFLSTWDGEEQEEEIDGELFYIYRTN